MCSNDDIISVIESIFDSYSKEKDRFFRVESPIKIEKFNEILKYLHEKECLNTEYNTANDYLCRGYDDLFAESEYSQPRVSKEELLKINFVYVDRNSTDNYKLYKLKLELTNNLVQSKYNKKALKIIAKDIGEITSASYLIEDALDIGIPKFLIKYPETKWVMILTFLKSLSESAKEEDQIALNKYIEHYTHPLCYEGDLDLAKKVEEKFSALLQYDGYEIKNNIITPRKNDTSGYINIPKYESSEAINSTTSTEQKESQTPNIVINMNQVNNSESNNKTDTAHTLRCNTEQDSLVVNDLNIELASSKYDKTIISTFFSIIQFKENQYEEISYDEIATQNEDNFEDKNDTYKQKIFGTYKNRIYEINKKIAKSGLNDAFNVSTKGMSLNNKNQLNIDIKP